MVPDVRYKKSCQMTKQIKYYKKKYRIYLLRINAFYAPAAGLLKRKLVPGVLQLFFISHFKGFWLAELRSASP